MGDLSTKSIYSELNGHARIRFNNNLIEPHTPSKFDTMKNSV